MWTPNMISSGWHQAHTMLYSKNYTTTWVCRCHYHKHTATATVVTIVIATVATATTSSTTITCRFVNLIVYVFSGKRRSTHTAPDKYNPISLASYELTMWEGSLQILMGCAISDSEALCTVLWKPPWPTAWSTAYPQCQQSIGQLKPKGRVTLISTPYRAF